MTIAYFESDSKKAEGLLRTLPNPKVRVTFPAVRAWARQPMPRMPGTESFGLPPVWTVTMTRRGDGPARVFAGRPSPTLSAGHSGGLGFPRPVGSALN
jgi:hypothetical protein